MAGTSRGISGRTAPIQDADDLVAGLRAREPAAWAELFTTYYSGLLRYIALRVGSSQQAEDLCSMVFLRALTRIDSYRQNGRPVIAWLYGITQNIIKEARREARRRQAFAPGDAGWEIESLQDPNDSNASLVSEIDLRSALKRLTEAQQEILLLRYVGGFSAKQVATMTARSGRAVYYLEARALLRLREELGAGDGVVAS